MLVVADFDEHWIGIYWSNHCTIWLETCDIFRPYTRFWWDIVYTYIVDINNKLTCHDHNILGDLKFEIKHQMQFNTCCKHNNIPKHIHENIKRFVTNYKSFEHFAWLESLIIDQSLVRDGYFLFKCKKMITHAFCWLHL